MALYSARPQLQVFDRFVTTQEVIYLLFYPEDT